MRFFVDETSLGVGRALALLRRDVIHTNHRLIPEVPLDTLDDDWIPEVAARELVVITRDKRIRTKSSELPTSRLVGNSELALDAQSRVRTYGPCAPGAAKGSSCCWRRG
ncbi:hypothetical protein AB0B89_27610 [Sphaerisporangium sp. NPDC049002]|uniref:PIN-like domain-containing protein n=1 Tax=unclassified Sphaerisporangium TaxID=2630420 RepID=UPI0033F00747